MFVVLGFNVRPLLLILKITHSAVGESVGTGLAAFSFDDAYIAARGAAMSTAQVQTLLMSYVMIIVVFLAFSRSYIYF